MSPAINRFLTDQQRDTARRCADRRAAQGRPRSPRPHRRPAPRGRVGLQRSVARSRVSAGDPDRVLRLPVPILPAGRADAQAAARHLRRQAAHQVGKDFPLTQIHPQAFKAGEAAHCAGDQGKYWELHDRLFANQQLLQAGGSQEARLGARPRGGGIQHLPRHLEVWGARAKRRCPGPAPGCELDADDLHQRPRAGRRAAGPKRSSA